jgi:hypothetical protein
MYTYVYILSLNMQSNIDRCSKYANKTTPLMTAVKVIEKQQHSFDVTLKFLFTGAGPVARSQFVSGRSRDQPAR